MLTIAAANMANAIREITVEQGQDPRRCALMPFGGAGPLFGTLLARELEIARIVVPPYAGNFSAWGLLGADLVRTAGRARGSCSLDDDAIADGERAAGASCSPTLAARAGVRASEASGRSGSTCATSGRSTRSPSRAAERGRPHHGGRRRSCATLFTREYDAHVRPHDGRGGRDRLRPGDGAHAAAAAGGGAAGAAAATAPRRAHGRRVVVHARRAGCRSRSSSGRRSRGSDRSPGPRSCSRRPRRRTSTPAGGPRSHDDRLPLHRAGRLRLMHADAVVYRAGQGGASRRRRRRPDHDRGDPPRPQLGRQPDEARARSARRSRRSSTRCSTSPSSSTTGSSGCSRRRRASRSSWAR